MNSEKIRTGEDRNSGKASFGLVLVLLIAVIIAGAGYKYIHGIGEPLDSSSQEKISVDIPSGSGTAAIGRILEEDGVIKSARQFKIKSRMDKNDGKYRHLRAFSVYGYGRDNADTHGRLAEYAEVHGT